MVIRIVRMHFRAEEVETFLNIFDRNKAAIRNFAGCQHLELMKDINAPNTFSTVSYWNGVEDLHRYRESQIFESVWAQVKKLFSARPEAFTLAKYIEV